MTAIHEFKCDGKGCGKRASAKYNGEHFLPPENWIELTCPFKVELRGHLCPACNPLNENPAPAKKAKHA